MDKDQKIMDVTREVWEGHSKEFVFIGSNFDGTLRFQNVKNKKYKVDILHYDSQGSRVKVFRASKGRKSTIR